MVKSNSAESIVALSGILDVSKVVVWIILAD